MTPKPEPGRTASARLGPGKWSISTAKCGRRYRAVELSGNLLEKLAEAAVRERRPIPLEASAPSSRSSYRTSRRRSACSPQR
jgi:hypothetical protein